MGWAEVLTGKRIYQPRSESVASVRKPDFRNTGRARPNPIDAASGMCLCNNQSEALGRQRFTAKMNHQRGTERLVELRVEEQYASGETD